MASCFCVLDMSGGPIIFRSYRGDVNKEKVLETFRKKVLLEEEICITPVFEEEGYTYTFIRENNVYLLMVSAVNCLPLLQIGFMKTCVKVWETYFMKVNEASVRDSFVIIYELLDEMCDFGYPQITEEALLKKYITQEGLLSFFVAEKDVLSKTLPAEAEGGSSDTPWRPAGKYSYRKNEAFLDVCEKVSMMMGRDGTVLSSEVEGVVKVKTRLSGMPVMQVCLNDKALFDITGHTGQTVDLEDIRFHPCVNLSLFERDRVISCVPPDGSFDLLNYRISMKLRPLVKIKCRVVHMGTSRVIIMCNFRTTFRPQSIAKKLSIIIPIPSDSDSLMAKSSLGAVRHCAETSKVIWTIRNCGGGKESACYIQFHLPSVRSAESSAIEKAPIEVKFEIPYMSASGFQIRYVKIKERHTAAELYEATPWVRYLTESGEYYSRMEDTGNNPANALSRQ